MILHTEQDKSMLSRGAEIFNLQIKEITFGVKTFSPVKWVSISESGTGIEHITPETPMLLKKKKIRLPQLSCQLVTGIKLGYLKARLIWWLFMLCDRIRHAYIHCHINIPLHCVIFTPSSHTHCGCSGSENEESFWISVLLIYCVKQHIHATFVNMFPTFFCCIPLKKKTQNTNRIFISVPI